MGWELDNHVFTHKAHVMLKAILVNNILKIVMSGHCRGIISLNHTFLVLMVYFSGIWGVTGARWSKRCNLKGN